MDIWVTIAATVIIGIFSIMTTIIGFLIKDRVKSIDTKQDALQKSNETKFEAYQSALSVLSENMRKINAGFLAELNAIKSADIECRANRAHANNDKIAQIDASLADHQSQLDSTNKEIIEMKSEMNNRFDDLEQKIDDLKDVFDKLPVIFSQLIDKVNTHIPPGSKKIDGDKVVEQVTVKNTPKKIKKG